jgi:hypothetical protein
MPRATIPARLMTTTTMTSAAASGQNFEEDAGAGNFNPSRLKSVIMCKVLSFFSILLLALKYISFLISLTCLN